MTDERFVYTIPGNPIAWSRAVPLGRGKVYDAQKNKKVATSIYIIQQHKNRPLLTGPLGMKVGFYFTIPMGVKKKSEYENRYLVSPPDLSNILKFIEDVCQGIVFANDCIIVETYDFKVYSHNPRTEVEYIPLSSHKMSQL